VTGACGAENMKYNGVAAAGVAENDVAGVGAKQWIAINYNSLEWLLPVLPKMMLPVLVPNNV
jgi:hypothetical protein